jgi:hypothetical protein
MKPNFETPLYLDGATTVFAGGPLAWESTRGSCRVDVKITQTLSGNEVVAEGRSRDYDPKTATWNAEATVKNGGQLQPGPAKAWGRVNVSGGGTKPNPEEWTADIELQ